MPNCISLDQAIVPLTMFAPERTFINCLASNDLEIRFLGTIFCEMDDLDQTPLEQTRIHLLAFEQQTVWAYFCILKSTFGGLNL